MSDQLEQRSSQELWLETLGFLTVRETEDGWSARTPEWFGDYLFGGFVIAQALAVAGRLAPAGGRVHSLHSYFLRPVRAASEVEYTARPMREGRNFSAHQLTATQDGKPALAMQVSFTADTDGDEYDLDVGEAVPPLDADAAEAGPGPWVAVRIGPTEPRVDGTRRSTHRMWFRLPVALPDDPALHTALLGFATDWTGTGGRPLRLDQDTQGMISLDHAVWFHRPCRADDWHFYDVQSLVNAGGRGLLRGVVRDRRGQVVVSAAQEMRLLPVGG